jgi:hypothetical protein
MSVEITAHENKCADLYITKIRVSRQLFQNAFFYRLRIIYQPVKILCVGADNFGFCNNSRIYFRFAPTILKVDLIFLDTKLRYAPLASLR